MQDLDSCFDHHEVSTAGLGQLTYLWRHSPGASRVGIHGINSISNGSRPGATILGQVHCKRRSFLVPPSNADYSRPDEPHKVSLQRRCPGLQLSTSSLVPVPGKSGLISSRIKSPVKKMLRKPKSERFCSVRSRLFAGHLYWPEVQQRRPRWFGSWWTCSFPYVRRKPGGNAGHPQGEPRVP